MSRYFKTGFCTFQLQLSFGGFDLAMSCMMPNCWKNFNECGFPLVCWSYEGYLPPGLWKFLAMVVFRPIRLSHSGQLECYIISGINKLQLTRDVNYQFITWCICVLCYLLLQFFPRNIGFCWCLIPLPVLQSKNLFSDFSFLMIFAFITDIIFYAFLASQISATSGIKIP